CVVVAVFTEDGQLMWVVICRIESGWLIYCGNNPLNKVDPTGLFTIALPFPITLPIPYIPLLPPIPIVPNLNMSDNNDSDLEVHKEKNKEILKEMQTNPPNHLDYKPPKNFDGKKTKTSRGSGWKYKKGNIWVPDDHKGTHDPHWDVQHPDGTYDPVYPDTGAYDDLFNQFLDWIDNIFNGSEDNQVPYDPQYDIDGDGTQDLI
ncbi:MAG: hypothetical protein JXB88_24080, partial [Spirochaetales bacterium]|nr:hypothetical protein [Spirochaetales bacterium]